MQVVARQQHNLAGLNCELLSVFVLDPDTKAALDDVVIGDQVGCRTEQRRAVLGRDPRGHAPRREELRLQEDAARELRFPEDVRQRIHAAPPPSSGAPVRFPGGPIIDEKPPLGRCCEGTGGAG